MDLEDLEHIVIIGYTLWKWKTDYDEKQKKRIKAKTTKQKTKKRFKKIAGRQEQKCSCQYPKSIVSEMLKRIKSISKGYWGLVVLLMVSSWNSEPSVLLYITWAVVVGYLIWKMKGAE